MPLARSFLYVPANREKFLEKAIGLPSDAFIFDLEDSVPPAEKANARAGVRAYGRHHPLVAGTHSVLGQIHRLTGDEEAARMHFTEAVASARTAIRHSAGGSAA